MRIIALTVGQKEDKDVIGIDFDGVIHSYIKVGKMVQFTTNLLQEHLKL